LKPATSSLLISYRLCAAAPTRGATAFAGGSRTIRYAPDIQEILVSGDLAFVRLVWSVTVQRGPSPAASKESGLDVFRRGPDGRWSIIRFLAYSNAPD